MSTALICVLFAGFAVCYGWGMRGTIIGGEKGAMLPGLYLGLILAWFAGGGIRENFWIPAAAGLMGMSYGGMEPYAETMSMILHRGSDEYHPVKGYIGLSLKGGIWFSVAGSFIALSMTAMSGKYSAAGIVIFCLLIPLIQQLGYNIFNRPFDREKGKRPAIYFSFESREEWGSNLALLVAILTLGVVKHDTLVLALAGGGFLAGVVGWIFAIKFYDLTIYPFKNGKYLFGNLPKNRLDGWKNMEFSLGAIGGAGIAFVFCLSSKEIAEINNAIAANGIFNPIAGAERFMPAVIAAIILSIIAINLYEYFTDKKGGTYNDYLFDCIERPFFHVFPMIFVLLGSQSAARLMTVFMLIFVCSIKNIADRYEMTKGILPVIVYAVCPVIVFVIDLVIGGFSPWWIIFAGGFPYIICEIWHCCYGSKGSLKRKPKEILLSGSFPTVIGFMIFQTIVIDIVSAFIF